MSQKKKKSVVGLDGSCEGKRLGGALSHFQAYVPTQKTLNWHKGRRGPRSWRCPGIQEERASEDGSGQKCLMLRRRPAWGELRNVRRTERRGAELEGAGFVRMKGRSPIEMG